MSARPDQSIILSYQECKFCKSSDGFVFYDSHGYCYHCNEIWFGEDYDQELEDMYKMHWTFRDDKTRVPDPDNYFGFVYLITNKKSQRKYIGCKQYWQMRHRKKYKPSNWRVYTSSSKELNQDIEKIGKRNFKFEIIQEYLTKRGLHYYEQHYQMKYHVLTAIIKSTGEKSYYNKNVGGIRFYCPVEKYEDPEYKKKRSELAKAQWSDPEFRKKQETLWADPEYKKKRSELSKAQWSDPEFRKKQSETKAKPENKKKRSELSKARWADPEFRKKQSETTAKPENKKKRSELSKAQWADPEFRKKQSEAKAKPEFRKRHSELSKARWADPEYRKRQETLWADPEFRKKRSELVKARWADPEYRKRQSEAMKGNTNSYKGPYRITFNTGKEIIIDNIKAWAVENGYGWGTLYECVRRVGRKYKDIVKVERLGKTNGDLGR